MNILIVNSADLAGGASRAANRLHRALQAEGITSKMLVQKKNSLDEAVISTNCRITNIENWLRVFFDRLLLRIYRRRSKALFSSNRIRNRKLVKKINLLNPDLVHLHWINDAMLSVDDLREIRAPIVWSLHDMWPFTGGCHYNETCRGFESNCGSCPVLRSNRDNDISRLGWLRKHNAFGTFRMHINGLSRWIAGEARASSLFAGMPVYCIPNPIDLKEFFVSSKREARNRLGLPLDKKIVLYGAMGALSDPRKGFSVLQGALDLVSAKDIALVVFGATHPDNTLSNFSSVSFLGNVHDDKKLRLIYNSADVMVVPSLQENLSNAIMESLACGTPVVAFNIGGNSDMIDHLENGYLAKPYEASDLAAGIQWVLNSAQSDILHQKARLKVEQNFESSRIAKKYIELYEMILKE